MLCCFALFVCLTLLASFFLPSHLSFKNMYLHMFYYRVYPSAVGGAGLDVSPVWVLCPAHLVGLQLGHHGARHLLCGLWHIHPHLHILCADQTGEK